MRQDDLFGTGHQLELATELAARRAEARMGYRAPALVAPGLDLGAEVFARRRDDHGFARAGAGGAISLSRWLGRSTRAYVQYRAELVTITPDDPIALARAALVPRGRERIAALGVGLAHDTLDARVAPRAGTRLELLGEVADPGLGATSAGAR